MATIKNFVDEKTSRKIIDAICALDYSSVLKLSDDSGVPVHRLQSFVDGDEKITQLDKGKLIIHLIKLVDIVDEEHHHEETNDEMVSPGINDFQRRKAG